MTNLSRRDFLKLAGQVAVTLGLGSAALPRVAEALEELAAGAAPVLWLQGLSCSGCSISFLNGTAPGPGQVLTDYISLLFHSNISAASGHDCMDIVHRATEAGGFTLVVEGAMPTRMARACMMGEEPMTELVAKAAARANAVLAVGTCASFGGIPAAENNQTGAMGVPAFLRSKQITTPTIALPGCPCHPDWLLGTLVHVLKFGLPELDERGRPTVFYGHLIHDQCPRFSDYERERFATHFGDDGCLFELGCLGPKTHADCTQRQWNSGVNTCIRAGAPCIGCASEDFAARASLPFYTKGTFESEERL